MHIRVDDVVEVATGDDRTVQGRVLSIDRSASRIVVEGVNRVYKHVRRSQRNPQGGRLSREMPIHWSNARIICPSCGKPTRVGARQANDGSKERFCKKCGAAMGTLSPAPEQAT